MARTRAGRVQQVANYLRSRWPTPYPVDVVLTQRFAKWRPSWRERIEGITHLIKGGRLLIELDATMTWLPMIEALLHEWAHARSTRHWAIEKDRHVEHDEEWGLAYQKIYSDWHDADGCDASCAFPERPQRRA